MPDSKSDPDIETGADTLLSFLEEKTKWPVSKIADDLGVPEDTVKRWAKALEKSGLVDIKYSAIKGMVLEYSSDKSYEELNEGRSQLALETDEIEIEAEEVEEIEEVEKEGEITETVHEESEEDQESSKEKEKADKSTREDNEEEIMKDKDEKPEEKDRSRSIDSHDEIKRKGFDKAKVEDNGEESSRKKLGGIETEEEDDKEDDVSQLSEEEGKEKLKNELEKLENQENKDENSEKQKVKAKKAKIKKNKKKVKKEKEENEEDSKEIEDDSENQDNVDKVHDKVKSKSSGKEVEHDSGENFGEHMENLKELGDLLRDTSVENDDVYSRMEIEMGALKNTLEEREIDEEMRKEVSETMEKVEKDIENEETPPGPIEKIKSFLTGVKE